MIEMYVCIGFNFCLSSSLEINNLNKRKSLTSAVLLLYFILFTMLILVHISKQATAQNLKHQQDLLYEIWTCCAPIPPSIKPIQRKLHPATDSEDFIGCLHQTLSLTLPFTLAYTNL